MSALDLILTEDSQQGWTVRVGERFEDQLGADEALWIIVRHLTGGPLMLRTEAEHAEFNARYVPKPPLEPWQKQLTAGGTATTQ